MANRDDDYFSLAYKMLGFGLILSTDEFNENTMKSYDVLNKDYYEETLTLLGYIAGYSAEIGRPHYVAGYLAGLDYRDPKYFKYDYKDLVTYTGKEIEPDLEIFDLNKKLEEGEDYSLSFEDNIEPGIAKMKVNFTYSPSGMSLTKTEVDLPFTIAIQTGGSSKKNINLTGSSVAASSKNSIKESDSNSKGTVILKSSKASKGQTVKAEIVPKDGYKATCVIITDKNGKQIETKLNDDNSFEFKMPSSNVNIEVIYEELPKSDEDIRIEEILDGIKKDDIILADSKEGEKITSNISFIRGYEDGSFKADNKVTNIEFMCMVTSLFKNLEDDGKSINLNQGDNY
ncbi:MAG: hypothetical protein MJ246_03520 [Clostridia bacterium]|nr:hypothetical protein [Clostridia bacterium]